MSSTPSESAASSNTDRQHFVEQNVLSNFKCCNLILPTWHSLLAHRYTAHDNQLPPLPLSLKYLYTPVVTASAIDMQWERVLHGPKQDPVDVKTGIDIEEFVNLDVDEDASIDGVRSSAAGDERKVHDQSVLAQYTTSDIQSKVLDNVHSTK